jgi:hypothetical protein
MDRTAGTDNRDETRVAGLGTGHLGHDIWDMTLGVTLGEDIAARTGQYGLVSLTGQPGQVNPVWTVWTWQREKEGQDMAARTDSKYRTVSTGQLGQDS